MTKSMLKTNSNYKNIKHLHKGINKFKKDSELGINSVYYENSDLLADLHILNMSVELLLSALKCTWG
jgi:hypothetical protein